MCSEGLERCGRGGWKAREKGLKIRAETFFSESLVCERDNEKRAEEKEEKRERREENVSEGPVLFLNLG